MRLYGYEARKYRVIGHVVLRCQVNRYLVVKCERSTIREWSSPLAPGERHRVFREGCIDGVRGSLLQMNEFKEWNTSEEEALHPVLFNYTNPRAGRTYLGCVRVALLKLGVKLDAENVGSL